MLKGAEIILVPNACLMEINRLSQLRGRAFENMTASLPATIQPVCRTATVTPQPLTASFICRICRIPRDTCILEAGEAPGIYLAEFDMDMLREYRKNEVHGNAYRHPQKYQLLVSEKIDDPFIRSDYRKKIFTNRKDKGKADHITDLLFSSCEPDNKSLLPV